MDKIFLTVFTPTYNRSNLLDRLFRSLCSQGRYDFEWLVVDDESTDDTDEKMREFINDKECKFQIKYLKQKHGGKHRAINYALDNAEGEFFFIVDSDDYLVENAVEKVYGWLQDISEINKFAGVSGLKVKEAELKEAYKKNSFVDVGGFEREYYGLLGDHAEIYRTDLMRKNKFPEYDGEYFVTEAVCWDAIAADGYIIRWYDEPIYVYDYLPEGLTMQGANKLQGNIKNHKGFCHYVSQAIKCKPLRQSMLDFFEYLKTSIKMKKNLVTQAADLNVSIFKYSLLLFELPFVIIVRKIDRLIGKKYKCDKRRG